MKNHIIQFDRKLARQINEQVALAGRIWEAAGPDLSNVRISAGNYAAYGRYRAQCHASGVIEIPVGNRFGLLEFSDDNTLVKAASDEELFGILLHELGHQVINTSSVRPWLGGKSIDTSTHLSAAWLWIAATGWNHFHATSITPNQIADSSRTNRDEWVAALAQYNPMTKPPELAPSPICAHCGVSLDGKRVGAKFCSPKCRVAAHRSE